VGFAYSTVKPESTFVEMVYCDVKSAVAAVRVTFTVPVPFKVPAPLITVAAEGFTVPLTVKVPAMEKLDVAVTVCPDCTIKTSAPVVKLAGFEPVPLVADHQFAREEISAELEYQVALCTTEAKAKMNSIDAIFRRIENRLHLATNSCDWNIIYSVSQKYDVVEAIKKKCL